MGRKKDKIECDECGVSALEAHVEYVKSAGLYLCEYCLSISDYDEARSDEYNYSGRDEDEDNYFASDSDY